MTAPALHDFSDLLLRLYRLAHELPIEMFQDVALGLIKPLVPFDASMWGTATAARDGIDVHTLHLHQKSSEMMLEYEEFKHLDSAAASFFGKGQGARGFNTSSWFSGARNAPIRDFLQRHDQNNIFIAMDSAPRSSFMHWFSLFRADEDAHCKPEEVHLLASLSPHMMQALALNRLMHLDRTRLPSSRGAAIADLRGAMYHCDANFAELIREEFTGWPSRALPSSLLVHFMTMQSAYLGQHVAVSARLEQRLLFLSVRRRCRADDLTPRERTVADLLARGDNHKRIASLLARSPATVRNHIQAIYDKLQVSNVAGLMQELQLAD